MALAFNIPYCLVGFELELASFTPLCHKHF